MDLSTKIAVLALVAQVVLTLAVFVRMGKARTVALAKSELHIRDMALSNDAWSDDVKKLGNNLQNQFETPIIFYIAVVLMAALSIDNWIITGAAVVFVGLRIVHHGVHTGKNHVPTRFKVFGLSLLALVVIWAATTYEIILL